MGGTEPFEDGVGADGNSDTVPLIPDTAHNNTTSMDSAREFYAACQEHGVPLIVLTRWTAYAAPVPRSVYEDMAATKHPVAHRLLHVQRAKIEGLWRRAAPPPGDARRGDLPARCNKDWFCTTFLGGLGQVRWNTIQHDTGSHGTLRTPRMPM